MGRLTAVLALAAVLAAPLAAQAPPPAPEEETKPGEKKEKPASSKETVDEQGRRVFKDEVVVTGTRTEQSSAELPTPITVISRQEIERAQPEKLVDLFKEIPGLEVFGEGPFRGIPVIRGLASNRVLILVDGQRLNNSRESTTFSGIQPGLVDLSEIERIEVVRGPASVQYGSDALGGVVNIITRKPDLGAVEFSLGGEAGYEYGTAADSNRARLEVNGQGRGMALRLAAFYQDAGNYESPRGEVPNSGMKQKGFDGSFRFLTGTAGVMRIGAEVVRTDDVGFPGFDPETSGVDIRFPNFDRDKVSLSWEGGSLGPFESLTLTSYYQQTVKESIRNLDFGMFFLNNSTRSEIDSLGLNAQATSSAGATGLIYGIDYYRDRLHDETLEESPFGSSNEVAVPDSTQDGIALYLQSETALSGRTRLFLGIRGDRFTFTSDDDPRYAGEPFDVTDEAVSGAAGLTWAATRHVDLTAMVSRGFRAPNLQERSFLGLATTGDTYILQNPNLASETSMNYEAGFKVRYARHFGAFNVYYNDIQDFITFVFLGQDPDTGLDLARFDNVEKATIQGVEFELESIVSNSWTVFETVSYTRGEDDTTGEPLGFIPPLKVVVGARFQSGSFWSEGRVRIVDNQDRVGPDQSPSPGFTVYSLRGGYEFANGLSLRATLDNLTDKAYEEPLNAHEDPASRRYEPGRNLRVSVAYRF